MISDKYYFVSYKNEKDATTKTHNVLLKGIHPIIWISKYESSCIFTSKVLLFWSEISAELFEEAKQLKYFPTADYTEKPKEVLCQKSK